jgi:hypothetical protein
MCTRSPRMKPARKSGACSTSRPVYTLRINTNASPIPNGRACSKPTPPRAPSGCLPHSCPEREPGIAGSDRCRARNRNEHSSAVSRRVQRATRSLAPLWSVRRRSVGR